MCNIKKVFAASIFMCLVVVAIAIYIVVCIKNDATQAIQKANIQTIRAYAITELLKNPQRYSLDDASVWLVDAAVTEAGTVTLAEISTCQEDCTQEPRDGTISEENVTHTIKVRDLIVTKEDVLGKQ